MAPSHYLSQCWVIFIWTLRSKLQLNFNQNTKLFIHENESENIICKMAAILSRGRWVNKYGDIVWRHYNTVSFPQTFSSDLCSTLLIAALYALQFSSGLCELGPDTVHPFDLNPLGLVIPSDIRIFVNIGSDYVTCKAPGHYLNQID